MWIAYLKIAIKVLLRRKFFTFISLFAVTTTLVVLIVAVSLFEHRYLPQSPESSAALHLHMSRARFSNSEGNRNWTSGLGFKLIHQYLRDIPGVADMTAHSRGQTTVSYREGKKVFIDMKYCDGGFWRVMDFQFLEGQPFSDEEVRDGHLVIVITERLRNQYFGDDTAVGEDLEIEGRRFRVAGVVANVPDYRASIFADAYLPHTAQKNDRYLQGILGNFNLTMLAESKDVIPQIKATIKERTAGITTDRSAEFTRFYTYADTLIQRWARAGAPWALRWTEDPGVKLKVMRTFAMILLFMLLPAINLININVSRIMERSSEIGVRKAFGATGSELTRQFLVENLVLTGVGGFLGIVLSAGVLGMINHSDLFANASLTLSPLAVVAGLLLSILLGLMSGVFPAWRMSRLQPVVALKGGLR